MSFKPLFLSFVIPRSTEVINNVGRCFSARALLTKRCSRLALNYLMQRSKNKTMLSNIASYSCRNVNSWNDSLYQFAVLPQMEISCQLRCNYQLVRYIFSGVEKTDEILINEAFQVLQQARHKANEYNQAHDNEVLKEAYNEYKKAIRLA